MQCGWEINGHRCVRAPLPGRISRTRKQNERTHAVPEDAVADILRRICIPEPSDRWHAKATSVVLPPEAHASHLRAFGPALAGHRKS